MANFYRIFSVTLILLVMMVHPVHISGQESTPTISPPRIVSATPAGYVSPGDTPTSVVPAVGTALSPVPLPIIVSATPNPHSSGFPLSSADQTLLDTSVSNFFNANSFQFSFNGRIDVETDDEFASLQITGQGLIEGIADPRNLIYQSQLRVDMQLNNEQQSIFIEQRITDGMFYFRGEDLTSGRETRWIGTRFSNLVNNILTSLLGDFSGLLGTGQTVPNDMELYEDLINLLSFQNFVYTRRMSSSADEVWFETVIDIEGFLDSPELVSSMFSVVSKLSAIDLGVRDVDRAAFLIGLMREHILPKIDLEISRFVDPVNEVLTQVEIDFESWVNFPTGLRIDFIPAQIEANVILDFSDYGSNFVVYVPENAHITDNIFDLVAEDVVMPE